MLQKKIEQKGFTLIELVITVTVLPVLALGTIPLVQNTVRRQKEQLLRDRLREIRLAIDEFRRDANGICSQNPMTAGIFADPRQRVMISDCKIFEASKENHERYPPTLEILVEGVQVTPRNQQAGGANMMGGGRPFDDPNGVTGGRPDGATGNNATQPKTKYYLREMPIDPMTEKSDWTLRSSYQEKDEEWDGNNVFDVRSSAEGETLDGIKYSDL